MHRAHSWDDVEEEMNFNEPIVLAGGSGPSASAIAAVRPRPPEAVSSSSGAAASVPMPLPVPPSIDPVEEARMLARKKQMELERMHEQVCDLILFCHRAVPSQRSVSRWCLVPSGRRC